MSLEKLLEAFDDAKGSLLTPSEAADYLGISESVLDELIAKGKLGHLEFPTRILLPQVSLEKYRRQRAIEEGEMMEIIFKKDNKFQGINPILHLLYQIPESTVSHENFHAEHISDIARLLNEQLDDYGYKASVEDKLRIDDHYYRPDVQINDMEVEPNQQQFNVKGLSPASPTQVVASPAYAESASLLIAKIDDNGKAKPVTVLELLSATNLKGEGLEQYLTKRQHFLDSGIQMVELHYLHRYPPFLAGIAQYPNQHHATPYHIIVTRPQKRDTIGNYLSQVYGFGVDEPIPNIAIPLLGQQSILFSFDEAYLRTFREWFLGYHVNYDAVPMEMVTKTFSAKDQTRIQEKLQAIRQEYLALHPEQRPD